MRALETTLSLVLAVPALGCTLLMPSDDELRGDRSSGGSSAGGSGGTSGVSGGGGFPTGGTSSGGTSAAACSEAGDFSSVKADDGTSPVLAWHVGTETLHLAFLRSGDVFTRVVDGSGQLATKLSSSGGAKELSASVNAASGAVGATWFDATLSFGAHPPGVAKPIYGTDPTLPAGKSPIYAAIAGAPSSNGFGVIWNGFGDSARRLYASVLDGSGANQTGGEGYTRITDDAECGDRNHQALVATASGFAAAWSWGSKPCGAGSASPPDIWFTTLDAGLSAPVSKLAVAPAAGASDYPALASSGYDFGLAWQDDRDGKSAIWFARVAGAAEVPGSLVKLSGGAPTSGKAPSVASGPKGYAVAWQSGSELHFSLVGAAPTDVIVASDALAGQTPSIVWGKDRWHVAWTRAGASPELRVSSCVP